MKTIKEQLGEIKSEIELYYFYEEGDTFKEFDERICESIYETEIIYYSKAIKYLANNDPSLSASIDVALEAGYELDEVNSELLATLLFQREQMSDWWSVASEVEEIFNNAEEE